MGYIHRKEAGRFSHANTYFPYAIDMKDSCYFGLSYKAILWDFIFK